MGKEGGKGDPLQLGRHVGPDSRARSSVGDPGSEARKNDDPRTVEPI
ncbi:MAG: hypothetical protein FD172_3907 [Methylocystaceae bacterium]|nr:MAG: hypothetical protein FD172_3907 [Methylocystaceae bacterium]